MKKLIPTILLLSLNSIAGYDCELKTTDSVIVKKIEFKGKVELEEEIPETSIVSETIFNQHLLNSQLEHSQNLGSRGGDLFGTRTYKTKIVSKQTIKITDQCGPSAPGTCNLNLKFINIMGREVESIFGSFIVKSEDQFNDVNIDALVVARLDEQGRLNIQNDISKFFNDNLHSGNSEITFSPNIKEFSLRSSTGHDEMQIWSELNCTKN